MLFASFAVFTDRWASAGRDPYLEVLHDFFIPLINEPVVVPADDIRDVDFDRARHAVTACGAGVLDQFVVLVRDALDQLVLSL